MDILNKVKHHREEEEQLRWEGTFAEYLEIVNERPEVAQTAHSRVYNMIKSSGLTERDGRKMYDFLGTKFLASKIRLNGLWKSIFIRQQSGLMSGSGFCC